MRSHPLFTAIVLTGSLLSLACGGDVIVEPRLGSLQVSTVTSGNNPDADGYTVQLDGAQPEPIGAAAQVTMTTTEGSHTVTLAGVAANCTVAEGLTQSVTVGQRTLALAQFTVSCQASGSSDLRWTSIPLPPSVTAEIGWFSGRSLWGTSPSDLFVIARVSGGSARNGVWHYDGAGWTEQVSRVDTSFGGIWGFSGNDVYAVGTATTDGVPNGMPVILHYDGLHWSEMPAPALGVSSLNGIWGSPGDIFAAGRLLAHFDGSRWSSMATPDFGAPELTDIAGTSGSDVWAIGDREKCFDCEHTDAIVLHYDGTQWSLAVSAAVLHNDTFTGIWAAAANDVWVAGTDVYDDALFWHYDGTSWSRSEPLSTSQPELTDVWASSSSDVYAAGPNVLLHYDGANWRKISDVGGFRVWGTSRDDVFVLRSDAILHGKP
jgi:hypothetical protein